MSGRSIRQTLIQIAQETGKTGWGGGVVVAGFDQDDNKCTTSIRISCLVISFIL